MYLLRDVEKVSLQLKSVLERPLFSALDSDKRAGGVCAVLMKVFFSVC